MGNKLQSCSTSMSDSVTGSDARPGEDEFYFKWDVDSSVLNQPGVVYSTSWSHDHSCPLEWKLKLQPFQFVDGNEYIGLSLMITNMSSISTGQQDEVDKDKKNEILVRYGFSLVDSHGKVKKRKYSEEYNTFSKLNHAIGYKKFLSRTDLMKQSNGYFDDGPILHILCRGWIKCPAKHKEEPSSRSPPSHLEILSSNFEDMLGNSEYSDVIIRTKTSDIPAHKLILTARSRVLAAMFRSNFSESKDNIVRIEDFDYIVVKGFLNYIYTGRINSDIKENAMDVMLIADKYEVLHLKQECEDIIFKNLTVENAVNIYVFIYFNSVPSLKTRVEKFVKLNKRAIVNSQAFQEFKATHAELLLDMILELE